MVKKRLMLGAAFAALSLVPLSNNQAAAAPIDNYDLDIYADWDNNVDVNLDWSVDVSKELNIYGNISIDGSVQADALSQATLDDKQMLSDNALSFEDYQNVSLDNSNFAEPDWTPEQASVEGPPHPATYSNTISSSVIGSGTSGNVGINMAAGDFNLQENAAVLSNADGFFPAETETSSHSFALAGSAAGAKSIHGSGNFNLNSSQISSGGTNFETITANGSISLDVSFSNSFNITGSSASASARSARTSGAAEAGSFSLQSLYNNDFNTGNADTGGGEADLSPELENTQIDNLITIDQAGNGASGNIGLNAAAGAFNIQKNALVIASVTGGHLAEATSGVLQNSQYGDTVVEDVQNNINLTNSLNGASGNIGVNLAAGVNNIQLNTLTIANALAGAPVNTGTGPGGGTGTGPGGGGGTGTSG
jgi:heat shock protein HslJ